MFDLFSKHQNGSASNIPPPFTRRYSSGLLEVCRERERPRERERERKRESEREREREKGRERGCRGKELRGIAPERATKEGCMRAKERSFIPDHLSSGRQKKAR